MKLHRFCSVLMLLAATQAFSLSGNSRQTKSFVSMESAVSVGGGFVAAATLALILTGNPEAAQASNTAAQISLNSVPPTTVKIDIKDLPVIGKLLSGTYTKIDDASFKGPPSVSIKSPKDKLNAIKSAATGGHLEFDVNGLVSTHLDVDIATNEAGAATVRVSSPLIPALPFKNAASAPAGDLCVQPSGKKTEWYKMTNVGSGESYYYNEETGVSQTGAPQA